MLSVMAGAALFAAEACNDLHGAQRAKAAAAGVRPDGNARGSAAAPGSRAGMTAHANVLAGARRRVDTEGGSGTTLHAADDRQGHR